MFLSTDQDYEITEKVNRNTVVIILMQAGECIYGENYDDRQKILNFVESRSIKIIKVLILRLFIAVSILIIFIIIHETKVEYIINLFFKQINIFEVFNIFVLLLFPSIMVDFFLESQELDFLKMIERKLKQQMMIQN